MGCNCKRCGMGKLLVTLTFGRRELLYDIRNLGYVEGDIMREDAVHPRHQVQDIGEEGNVDRVTRVLDLVFNEVGELLYPYSKRPVERLTPPSEDTKKDSSTPGDSSKDSSTTGETSNPGDTTKPDNPEDKPKPDKPDPDAKANDRLLETETYELELKVPEDFSLTTVGLLEQLIHEFLVDRVLEDWLRITNTEASAKWSMAAEATRYKIRSALTNRTRPLRRSLTPW